MCVKYFLLGIMLISSATGQYNSLGQLATAIIQNMLAPLNNVMTSIGDIFQPPPFNETVQFYCANPSRQGMWEQVFLDDENITAKIDPTIPLGFLIHGWLDSSDVLYVHDVTNQWVFNRNENVCRVNWNRLSVAMYEVAATINVRTVATYIAQFIRNLDKIAGIKPENITLVGHSLGAQISGFVGQHLGGRLKMIIGLDAAGIYFTVPFLLPANFRLDPTDAQLVQLIHTSDGILGVNYPSGHQDFYGNNGFFPQRGCIWPQLTVTYQSDPITCAHYRSIDYFRDSLNATSECWAVKCENLAAYAIRLCSRTVNRIGLDAHPEATGRFFFSTTAEKPASCSGQFW